MNPDWIANLLILLVLALAATWLGTRLVRARHPAQAGRAEPLDSQRRAELLSDENSGLKRKVGRLDERIAVLERIATDPAERTAREIESLR